MQRSVDFLLNLSKDTYPYIVTSVILENGEYYIKSTTIGFRNDIWVCDEPIRIKVSEWFVKNHV